MHWQAPTVLVAGAGYAWWATALHPFSALIYVAVGLPVPLLMALWWQRSRSRVGGYDREGQPPGRSLAVWAALLGALVAWELFAYVSSPRAAHPTLSSMSDYITGSHPARAVVFGLWLVLGGRIFLAGVGVGAGAGSGRT